MSGKEIIQKIKNSADIVEIAQEFVDLKRSGSRYKGLSPFSSEKSPSFFVNPDSQFFYCFSTNKGGDVIDLVMQVKGMSFPEAIQWLAQKAGIEVSLKSLGLKKIDNKLQEEYDSLIKLNRFAAHFFQNHLQSTHGEIARSYTRERGLSEKTIKNFGIGFAPEGWSGLRDYLIQIKAPIPLALRLGLLKTKGEEKPREDNSNIYDVFRNRLMFPIRNANGEIVGFGGRALDAKDSVKYINSPDSPIYTKGHILFNYDRARKYIREQEKVVVVEGYMDCISLDQAGIQNVVATLGTALTPEQVHILAKAAPRIINLYDADSAGKAASYRNMDLFLKETGIPLSGVFLPESKDPDEFLRKKGEAGVEQIRHLINQSPALLDLWIDHEIASCPKNLEGRTECLKTVAGKVSLLKDEISIKSRATDLSNRLILDIKLVFDAIRLAKKEKVKIVASVEAKKNVPLIQKTEKFARQNDTTLQGFEAQFLRYLLIYPERLQELQQMQNINILPLIENESIRRVMEFLLNPDIKNERETSEQQRMNILDVVDTNKEPGLRNFISKALTESGASKAPAAKLSEILRKLNTEVQEKKSRQLQEKIKRAESNGNTEELEQLQKEFVRLIQTAKQETLEINNG